MSNNQRNPFVVFDWRERRASLPAAAAAESVVPRPLPPSLASSQRRFHLAAAVRLPVADTAATTVPMVAPATPVSSTRPAAPSPPEGRLPSVFRLLHWNRSRRLHGCGSVFLGSVVFAVTSDLLTVLDVSDYRVVLGALFYSRFLLECLHG